MNYGMQVTITYNENSHMGNIIETLNNVTEIHYNYVSAITGTVNRIRVAFESDIHGIGCTRNMSTISEFEAVAQDKKAKDF